MKSQRKNILTNQIKNEYFQENLEKGIKITKEMILSEVTNDILETKSKSQGKRRFFEMLFSLITSKNFCHIPMIRAKPLPFHFEKVFF